MKLFIIEHLDLKDRAYIEGELKGEVSEEDISSYINDYSPEKGEKITVYELVPVTVYEVTNGFRKVK